jgi:hypothetical protein
VAPPCPFAVHSPTPCEAPACLRDATSLECIYFTAEYCSQHADDKGCIILTYVFEAEQGQDKLLVLPNRNIDLLGAQDVMAVDMQCGGCGERITGQCPGAPVDVLSVQHDPGEQLAIEAKFYQIGQFVLCVAGQDFAQVTVTPPDCQVDSSVCVSDPCTNDPASLECQQLMAEYCSSHKDAACDQLLFRFAATEHQRLEFELSGPALEGEEFKFVRASCPDCNCQAQGIVIDLAQYDEATGTKYVWDPTSPAHWVYTGQHKTCPAGVVEKTPTT